MGRVIRLGSAHRSCECVTFRADSIWPDPGLHGTLRVPLSAYVSPAYRPFRHAILLAARFHIYTVLQNEWRARVISLFRVKWRRNAPFFCFV